MSKPEAKQRAGDFVLATIIAAVVFSSFAFVIRIKPHQKASENTEPVAGIFSLEPDEASCGPQHKHLLKWLEYKDPTHVTLPPEEGLNRDHPSRNWIYRDSEFFSKKNSLPTAVIPLIKQDPYLFEPRLPVVPPQDAKQELALHSLTRISFPLPKATAAAPKAGVYWLDEMSRNISDLPVLPLTSLKEKGQGINGPTYLTVTPLEASTYQPRVNIERSCGDRGLDLIASRHLARWLRSLTVQKSNPLRETWLMSPRKIAVVWRHVPGITYRPPKETLEEPGTDEPDAG